MKGVGTAGMVSAIPTSAHCFIYDSSGAVLVQFMWSTNTTWGKYPTNFTLLLWSFIPAGALLEPGSRLPPSGRLESEGATLAYAASVRQFWTDVGILVSPLLSIGINHRHFVGSAHGAFTGCRPVGRGKIEGGRGEGGDFRFHFEIAVIMSYVLGVSLHAPN